MNAPIDTVTLFEVKGYRFSPEFFAKGYPSGGGPCGCSSACCADGVYADVRDRDRILEVREIVKEYMDETQTRDVQKWFEEVEEEDADFPSGRSVGTNLHNGKCVFLDKFGRCSLQVAATERKFYKWTWKPMFCILYPVYVTEKVVAFDDQLQEEQSCCTIKSEFDLPLFQACKEELEYLVGQDGYALLEERYRSLAK